MVSIFVEVRVVGSVAPKCSTQDLSVEAQHKRVERDGAAHWYARHGIRRETAAFTRSLLAKPRTLLKRE